MGFTVLFSLLCVILSLISLSYGGVNAGRTIFVKQDMELENQLSIRGKLKPVKTIKTQVGDVYDCIHIQKQPALYHPMLKNHTVQMKPTTSVEDITEGSTRNAAYSLLRLIVVDCPEGTVPIQRVAKDDLIRINSFSKSHVSNIQPQSPEQPGKHFDIMKSRGTDPRFYGVGADINTHNLTVGADQSSTAQMWIENTIDNQLTSLQAGWTVSPPLNGDGITRLFAFWQAGAQSCFNTFCSAFTQVNNKYPVNAALSPVSEYNGQQTELGLSIFKDKSTGNWWLQVHHDPNRSRVTPIGYWAKEVVPNLAGGASYVAWGGLATGPPNGPSPPLGNGHFFDYDSDDFTRQAYYCRLKIYDESMSLNHYYKY